MAVLPVLLDGRAALEPLLPQALPGREGDLKDAVEPVLQVEVLVLGQAELLEDAEGGEHEVAPSRELAESLAFEISPQNA